MKKKFLYPTVIGSVLTAVILVYSINVMAYEKGTQKEFQSDRTLLKEIIANQIQIHIKILIIIFRKIGARC